MKKITFALLITCFSLFKINAQNSTFSFKEYIHMYPLLEYPFVTSFIYKNATPIKQPVIEISKEISNNFICKHVNCRTEKCDTKYLLGTNAIGQFKTDTNIFHMVLTALDMETGCENKFYLLTYSPEGNIIDTLSVFSEGWISKPQIKYKFGEYYYIESKIISNSKVEIYLKEDLGDRIIKDQKRFQRLKITKTIYSISNVGKFEKTEEMVISDGLVGF